MKKDNKNKINYYYIKEKLLKYISNNRLFLSYFVISLLISFLLRLITVGGHIYLKAFLTDGLFVLLFGSFGYFFKPKSRFTYYFILLFFYAGLAVGNTIYYQFYQSFISINLLKTASMIGEVNDALWAKIHLSQFVYLIFLVIFIYINKYLKKTGYYEKVDELECDRTRFKKSLIISGFIILILLCTLSLNDSRKLIHQYNKEFIIKKYGLYLYTMNDLVQSIELNESVAYDEAALAFRNYYSCKSKENKKSNEYTNIFKGKNVLFIHAESIQNFLIDLKINNKEVTPNINKFSKEGMYFTKFYPQISVGTSSDTEFTLLTGLMPSSKGTVFVNYYDREYYGMPNYFKELGYYTFSMHGNDANYWNRKTMHKALGYDQFYAEDSYVIPNEDDKDYVGLGLSDKSFFKQSIPILKNIKENNSPFFGTMITLSNHLPFSDVTKYGEFDVNMKYQYTDKYGVIHSENANYLEYTTMGNYLKSSHYADEAFGELIDNLKKENLLDNTIIVFYGDHEARISKKQFDLLYNYDPKNNTIIDEDDPTYISMDNYNYDLLKNTPLIIWSNDENLSSQINETMGMYDVLPTIANMFGFDEKYSLGHDIFSDDENIVVFPNGNILTDKVYYSESNEEYITFTDSPIDTNYINKITEYANNILEVSNGIVNYDLIKNESDKLGECNEK